MECGCVIAAVLQRFSNEAGAHKICPGISFCIDLLTSKNYGFTPDVDFNPLFTKFNLPYLYACILRVCSRSSAKRKSKQSNQYIIM